MATIGFIGLGNMGGPMMRNLLKVGHSVRAFDLSDAARKAATDAGATVAAAAADTAEGADVVVSMLPAGEHVKAVYLGEGGAACSSTVRPSTSPPPARWPPPPRPAAR